ncbi:MAG: threonine-phosphate decarboxylase [Desulfobacterales bacterium]|nr:threonine-phosphate decarboxylase [Desulfobacterales bacterium]
MIQGHGGDTYRLAKRLDCPVAEIVDMSSNVNPLGPPPGLMAFLAENADCILNLPEADAETAASAFADQNSMDPGQVVAGNGTTELIYLMPRAFGIKSALIVGPTYADYADACRMAGTRFEYWHATSDQGFKPRIDLIGRSVHGHDAVFICNPNNPTGTLMPREALEGLCRANPETVFVVDESYLPFAGDFQSAGMAACGLTNVVVLNSMSKIFRVPGLRIGFAAGSAELMGRCRRLTLPWSQNALAQAAAVYLMEHAEIMGDFIEQSRVFINREREGLIQALNRIDAIEVFDSCTSFILCRIRRGPMAAELWDHLARKRTLIRDCTNFYGLDETYFRISLKLTEDNRRVAEALADFFTLT